VLFHRIMKQSVPFYPVLFLALPMLTLAQTVPLSPNNGAQGAFLAIAVTGTNTQFDRTTTVVFSGTGMIVETGQGLTVWSPTSLTILVDIAPDATVSLRTLTITTGAEVVTGVFTVTVQTSAEVGLIPRGFGVTTFLPGSSALGKLPAQS